MAKWITVFADAPRGGKIGVCDLSDRTIRLDIRVNVTGSQLRMRFGNRYGVELMQIGGVTVWNGSHGKRVTFDGKDRVELAVGEVTTSDVLDFTVQAGDTLRVLLYFPSGCPVPRSVSATFGTVHSQPGDYTDQPDFVPAEDALRAPFPFPLPEPLPGLTAIDLFTDSDAKAIIAFGDSITEFSTWTIPLAQRLADKYPGRAALLNLGIGGNRLLMDTTPGFAETAGNMFGDAGIKRADWDIFEHQGVDCVLFALGINDVSQPGSSDEAPPLSERISTEAFVQAVSGLADRLHQKKIRIIGCAITPFGGMGGCCEETMQQRLEINHWLKKAAGEGILDGYIDFASAVDDPANPGYLLAECDCGDHLHPSPAGGKRMSDAIELEKLMEQH